VATIVLWGYGVHSLGEGGLKKSESESIPQMGYEGMIEKIAEKLLNYGDSIKWHSSRNFKATMKGINKRINSSIGIIMFKKAPTV
jgi:hypothetical protein